MFTDRLELSPKAIYNQLVLAESRSTKPSDPIRVRYIPSASAEFAKLVKSDVSPDEIRAGVLRREYLLDAGFVFNNILGNGEKPIIKANIDDMDFGQKRLLTSAELAVVSQYQQEHPELFGWQGQDPETVRQDMVHFLLVVGHGLPNITSRWNIFNRSIIEIKEQRVATDYEYIPTSELMYREVSRFDAFVVFEWHKHHRSRLDTEIGDIFRDVYPWPHREFMGGPKIRGHRAFTMGSQRIHALQGTASPFLDSGYYFGTNFDVTVEGKILQEIFRFNSATLHLASRGLSEMGESTFSFDQHYGTIGEYITELFPKDPKEREDLWRMEALAVEGAAKKDEDDVVEDFKRRIIDLSREWFSSSKAPLISRLRAQVLKCIPGYKHEPRWVNSAGKPLPFDYDN